jgi:hypothetical protein
MGNLHPAIEGALVGVVVALALYGLEYYLLKKQAAERAVRQHKKVVELDSTEKARLYSSGRMCLVVPLFFAAMNWMIS